MSKTRQMLVLAIAIAGLAACGDDDGGSARTVTAAPADTSAQETPAPTPAPLDADAILIETRVTDARLHKGKVVSMSIGESTLCRDAKTTGGSDAPTIRTTLHCPGGTLEVQYAPTQRSLVQGSVWEVVRGTGRFEGLRGGGSMVASFDRDDPDTGREIFTGTVGK